MAEQKRVIVRGTLRCAVLLALLAVCGVFASTGKETKMVSVPVTAVAIDREAAGAVTMEQARERLNRRRLEEIAVLDEVIAHNALDAQTQNAALMQKTQLAQRMEAEAQAEAALACMGYGQAAVVCGAQGITVFAPYAYLADESQSVRIIDCVSTQTGAEPGIIKIILAKNE